MGKKKGKGEGKETGDKWGDGINWKTTDFVPAWNLDETFQPGDGVPFSTELPAGQSQLYLPLFINNDNEQDGTDILILTLDSDETSVGFSQETYLLKESWDTQAGGAGFVDFSVDLLMSKDGAGNYQLSVNGEPSDALSKMYLVNGASRPNDTPKLVAGSGLKQAIVLIEDADSPAPVQFGDGNDFYFGSDDIDVVYAGAGKDKIWGKGADDTLRGESGDDVLKGGNGDDALFGEAGNDILKGGNSNTDASGSSSVAADFLVGGSGDDILYGGAGIDVLYGMSNDDTLYGGTSEDILFGGNGNDVLFGGSGGTDRDQWLAGGDGDDVIFGGVDRDDLYGGNGNDHLEGEDESDFLQGDGGDDFLDGGDGADLLNGYGNTLTEQGQIDILVGGSEADTFSLGGFWGVSYVEVGDGYAVIADWEVGVDKFQVTGNLFQYSLEFKNVLGTGLDDTEIYYTDSSGNRDRIAIVQDTTAIDLAIDFTTV